MLGDIRLPSSSIEAVRRYQLGEAEGEDVRHVHALRLRRLAGGRNNSLFAFQHSGKPLCLKLYQVDTRQRAGTEWHALTWLSSHGYHFAPRPFHHYADASPPAVVLEFIDGTWLGEQRLSRTQLESLVEAHQQMYSITPDSPDGRFRPATGNARVMVRRVTTGEWGTDPTAGDALAQEAHALWQTWRKGDDPALLLEPAPLVFSRGDPNLANCSWSRQRLRIVDFEYSGWSDRATDLADLVEHVQSRGTPDESWEWFVEQFNMSGSEWSRFQAARRLSALFWLMKMWARRALEPSGRKDQRFVSQLLRARSLCAGQKLREKLVLPQPSRRSRPD